MMLRVITDGSPTGVRILDQATGEDLTRRLCAVHIAIELRQARPPAIVLELFGHEVDVAGVATWRTADPATGTVKPVARIEFQDGSSFNAGATS